MSVTENYTTLPETESDAPGIRDFFMVFKRRRKAVSYTAGFFLSLALLLVLFWPPTYSTTSTILIEEQEIPEDMVRSTITSYATQQIEVIRARVLTLQNIMKIVDKFELYDEDELARTPRTEIVEDFIEATSLDLLNAEVIDPRSGKPTEATIAFSLTFEADGARKALNVTNELTNLFLNENLRTRTEKTTSTSEFLQGESNRLRQEVHDLESKIAQFKSENQAALPENFQLNMQNLTRYQSQLLSAESQLQQATKRILDLESRLATASPYAPVVLPSGEAVLGDVDRLKALQSEYRRVAARYSESHPDVIRIRREIDALVLEVGNNIDRDELQRLFESRQNELVTLKSKYSAEHPEVKALQATVAQLDKQLSSDETSDKKAAPDNPAYIMLDNQLESLRSEKAALEQQIKQFNDQIVVLNTAAAMAPSVEREYTDLQRNLEVASAKYLDLRLKLKEAQLAGELEEGRKGQRFTLIEPPVLPEEPTSPNRLAILILGIALSIGTGLAAGLLVETMDPSIRNVMQISRVTGIEPLVSIPYIHNPRELEENRPDKKLQMKVGIAVCLFVLLLIGIHLFYQPLDVMWYQVLHKLGIG